MASLVLQQLDQFGPDRCEQLNGSQADAYVQQLTESQYENFTVASWFLPKRYRHDFYAVYAFCRWADDLGDETGDTKKSIDLLHWWQQELDACYAGKPHHPVFIALTPVIEKKEIPQKPFSDLIDAFVQDQTVVRYESWDKVLDYCTRSANPVGRLVLYIAGYGDEQRQRLSDATCTALQLANFWQDVRRDIIERNRVYIPHDIASRHGLEIERMVRAVHQDEQRRCATQCCSTVRSITSPGVHAMLPAYQKTIEQLVNQTAPLFQKGRTLLPMLARDVRLDVELFGRGGESVLQMVQRLNYNTLLTRPSLSKAAKMKLMLQAIVGRMAIWQK